MMTEKDIIRIRLHTQHISSTPLATPGKLLERMGPMQSQDFGMSQWAIGLRLPDCNMADVHKALADGLIMRTHVMRPTWHLVPATDLLWLLQLTAVQVRAKMKTRSRQLGLTAAVFRKSNSIIERVVGDGEPLKRELLVSTLQKAKISMSDNRAAHLLMEAELSGLIAGGPIVNGKMTYQSLAPLTKKKALFDEQEALAKLALTYFSSRGPATLADFCWWSGLSQSRAKKGIDEVHKKLSTHRVGDFTYWLDPSFEDRPLKRNSVILLPAYDEYLIAYRDRSAALAAMHHNKMISSNGIFWPAILVDGKVSGMWKRSVQKGRLDFSVDFFDAEPPAIERKVVQWQKRISDFMLR